MSISKIDIDKVLSEYKDKVYRICCAYVKDGEDRKDIYQEVMIRIWRNINSFRGESSIGTWIYRITVNTCIDFLRRLKRIEDINIILNTHLNAIVNTNDNPEKVAMEKNVADIIYHFINTMGILDKIIVSLYLEDLSYKEIADVLGISESNVGVRVHRIKKNITEFFNGLEK